jgi:hypothetical protein
MYFLFSAILVPFWGEDQLGAAECSRSNINTAPESMKRCECQAQFLPLILTPAALLE